MTSFPPPPPFPQEFEPPYPPTERTVTDVGFRRSPDVGTPRSRMWAVFAILAAIGLVAGLQQFAAIFGGPKAAEGEAKIVAPTSEDPFALSSSMMIKFLHFAKGMQGGKIDPTIEQMVSANLHETAQSDVDKFRAVIAHAELEGATSALSSLDNFTGTFEGVEQDTATLRTILETGTKGVSDGDRTRFVERHGYFARLALSRGLPDNDPARIAVTEGGGRIMLILITFGVFLLFVGLASLVCFVIMIMKIANKGLRKHFVPPTPGGSVHLELVAIFIAGFLALNLCFTLASKVLHVTKHGGEAPWFTIASLLAQWVLLLAVLWPVKRGQSWEQTRVRLGWTKGEGVLREMGAGVFAYLASLPLLIAAMVASAIIIITWTLIQKAVLGHEPTPPSNPIVEIMGSGSPAILVVLFIMATIWAPIVEETIFRGSLYHHLRGRKGMILAGLISAACFALMHGYMILMLLPVFTLGFIFALMREWRGSLIASATVHALHNATVLAMAITLFSAFKVE